jgi:hypothetical protein
MRSGYIDEEREAELTALCDEVVRMLSAQMISLDRETGANKGFR